MNRSVYIINISGGKDSTAVMLLALARRQARGGDYHFVFADTGHENKHTYDYVDYLRDHIIRTTNGQCELTTVSALAYQDEARFARRRERIIKDWSEKGVDQGIIDRVIVNMTPTDNVFLNISKLNNGFPSPNVRFCTDHLKIRPIQKQVIEPYLKAGRSVIQWLGVRRDESKARAHTPLYASSGNLADFFPIRHWSADQVFAFIAAQGLKRNPLYNMGFDRVGCAPCIMAKKSELKLLSEHFPEDIERVAEFEQEVAKVGKRPAATTFFNAKKKEGKDRYQQTGQGMRIVDIVRWAKNRELTQWHIDDLLENDRADGDWCGSGYCE